MEHNYMTSEKSLYPILKDNARRMRQEPTEAESILWSFLCDKKLNYRFRRQHIIDEYIVDFVCLQKKLIIEIDGKYHDTAEQQELDKRRQKVLEDLGYTILRFSNEQVSCDIEHTLLTIKQHLNYGIK